MIVQERFNVLFQLQFYNIFTNVLPNVFINILKIYDLPKKFNKKPKFCQTLISRLILCPKFLGLLNYAPVNFIVP